MAGLLGAGFASFVSQRMPTVLSRAREDLSSVDFAQMQRVVHRIAGTLGTYGVSGIAESLRSLESELRTGLTESEARRRITEIVQSIDKLSVA